MYYFFILNNATAKNASMHPIRVDGATPSPYTAILESIAPTGTININTPVFEAPTFPDEIKNKAVLKVPGITPTKIIAAQNVESYAKKSNGRCGNAKSILTNPVIANTTSV